MRKGLTLSHGADHWPAVCLWTRGRVVVQGQVPRASVVLGQVRLDSLDPRAQLGLRPWRVVARSHGDPATRRGPAGGGGGLGTSMVAGIAMAMVAMVAMVVNIWGGGSITFQVLLIWGVHVMWIC